MEMCSVLAKCTNQLILHSYCHHHGLLLFYCLHACLASDYGNRGFCVQNSCLILFLALLCFLFLRSALVWMSEILLEAKIEQGPLESLLEGRFDDPVVMVKVAMEFGTLGKLTRITFLHGCTDWDWDIKATFGVTSLSRKVSQLAVSDSKHTTYTRIVLYFLQRELSANKGSIKVPQLGKPAWS